MKATLVKEEEKVEGQQDSLIIDPEQAEKQSKKIRELCPKLKKGGRCIEEEEYLVAKRNTPLEAEHKKFCNYAHWPHELEIVKPNLRVKQLKAGISQSRNALIESKPFKPWLNTGPKDTVEGAFKTRNVPGFIKKKKVNSDDEEEEEEEKAKREKLEMQRNVYLKDIDNIEKYPWKFNVPDEPESEEEDHALGGGGGRAKNRAGARNNKVNEDSMNFEFVNADGSDDEDFEEDGGGFFDAI